MTTSARFIALFGPEGFADHVPGLPGPHELPRRVAPDAAGLLRDLAHDGATLLLVHADRSSVLPTLAPARSGGAPRVPLLVVGCRDAEAAAAAISQGADLAARRDAAPQEVESLVRVALELRSLSGLVLKDDLTTAWNRRYFDTCLAEGLDRARRSGTPLSLIFMDIDNLKAVNIRHGHSMGSQVLREAALRLIATVRGGDAVIRYGGDEFCVVLPGLGCDAALEVAERLRGAVADAPFQTGGEAAIRLTASFGIATFPDHAADAHGLVAAADAAMLSIKDRQKNGIHVAGAA